MSGSNLNIHNKSCHKDKVSSIASAIEANKKVQDAAKREACQPDIEQAMQGAKLGKVSTSASKQRRCDAFITKAVTDFIITDILPISLVSKPGFLTFMDKMRADLKMPCSKTVVRQVKVIFQFPTCIFEYK